MSSYTHFWRIVVPCLLLVLVAGCGPTTSSSTTAPTASAGSLPAGATMQLVLAASEIAVGPNRFPLGLIVGSTPANDPQVTIHLQFHEVGNDPDKIQSEADAVYRGQGLPLGIYVAEATFPRAGDWTVNAQVIRDGKPTYLTPMRFTVLDQARTPAVGTPAIATKNLTARDMPDLKQLTSDINPDPALYQLTIADAIAAHKPFLVAFATPGYCQSATCGPNISVIKKLKDEFSQQMNFIHVEVYPYPFGDAFEQGKRVPAMDEWHLQTEPWTFLVDSQGIIRAKYEGGITLSELEPELKKLAANQS